MEIVEVVLLGLFFFFSEIQWLCVLEHCEVNKVHEPVRFICMIPCSNTPLTRQKYVRSMKILFFLVLCLKVIGSHVLNSAELK